MDEDQVLNVGDVMYKVYNITNVANTKISKIKCINAQKQYLGHFIYYFDDNSTAFSRNIGKSIFYTEEEAEQYVRNRHLSSLKRRRLKEYEQKLNEQLGITSIIIK